MICNECGAKNSDNANFCSVCGHKLKENANGTININISATTTDTDNQFNNTKTNFNSNTMNSSFNVNINHHTIFNDDKNTESNINEQVKALDNKLRIENYWCIFFIVSPFIPIINFFSIFILGYLIFHGFKLSQESENIFRYTSDIEFVKICEKARSRLRILTVIIAICLVTAFFVALEQNPNSNQATSSGIILFIFGIIGLILEILSYKDLIKVKNKINDLTKIRLY